MWESLVKFQGNLRENMSIWHFDHLTKEIWHEHNIMIIIQQFKYEQWGESKLVQTIDEI